MLLHLLIQLAEALPVGRQFVDFLLYLAGAGYVPFSLQSLKQAIVGGVIRRRPLGCLAQPPEGSIQLIHLQRQATALEQYGSVVGILFHQLVQKFFCFFNVIHLHLSSGQAEGQGSAFWVIVVKFFKPFLRLLDFSTGKQRLGKPELDLRAVWLQRRRLATIFFRGVVIIDPLVHDVPPEIGLHMVRPALQ